MSRGGSELSSVAQATVANARSVKAIGDALGRVRAVAILTMFLISVAIFIPTQALLLLVRAPWARAWPHRYMQFLTGLLGIKINVHGEMVRGGPVLIAANHVSYLDILVLSALGEIAFIAKTQVGGWPIFGQGARVMRTIFVDRDRRQRAMHDRNQIQDRLRAGDALVLFPEGTSTDGNGVAPFKSSLLSVAEIDLSDREAKMGRPYRARVQPVSLAYTRLNGLPMGRRNRPALRLVWRHGPCRPSLARARRRADRRRRPFPSAGDRSSSSATARRSRAIAKRSSAPVSSTRSTARMASRRRSSAAPASRFRRRGKSLRAPTVRPPRLSLTL